MIVILIAALLMAGCASGSSSGDETTVIQSAPVPMFIHPAPGGLGPRPRR